MTTGVKLATVALLLPLVGCGTVFTQLQMDEMGRCPDSRNGVISSPVFSGVVYDWRGMTPPPGDRARVFDILFLADLPLSAVADTLMLPFTIPRSKEQQSWVERTADGFPKEYFGFAVSKLNDSRWFLFPEQQLRNRAHFFAFSLSRTHTAFGEAVCGKAPFKVANIQELRDVIDARSREVSGRHEFISCVTNISTHKGRECIAYSIKVLDKTPLHPAAPLVMTFDGFILVHPDSDDLFVDAYFSERGTKDEIGKGTADLRQEFLESIEIKSIK